VSRRWYSGLPSTTVEVSCGEARHALHWRKGRIIVEDHDVDAELALSALGADPPPCLQMLAAWRDGVARCDSVRWLTAAVLPPSPEGVAFMAHAQVPRLPPVPGLSRARRRQMLATAEAELRQRHFRHLLTSSGPDWLRRVATAATVHTLRGAERVSLGRIPEDDVDVAEVLNACVVPAVEENIRRWRGPRASRQWFLIECRAFEGAGPVGIAGSVDDHVGLATVTVPLQWLIDVWARNAALIDDCFVLAARRIDGATLSVDIVRWERDASGRSYPVVGTGRAHRTGDHWRLL
jgi:hypothetical protein